MDPPPDPYPRVRQGVGGVGGQVGGDRQQPQDVKGGSRRRVIVAHDGIEEVLPDPVEGEDRLGQDGPGDDAGEGQEEQGEHRGRGGPESVVPEDSTLGEALGPGHEDEVLPRVFTIKFLT